VDLFSFFFFPYSRALTYLLGFCVPSKELFSVGSYQNYFTSWGMLAENSSSSNVVPKVLFVLVAILG
jgi:hypothetical protein